MLSGDTALDVSPHIGGNNYVGTVAPVDKAGAEISIEDALKPDPGTERDFEVKDNCFAFSPGQLNKFLNPKSLPALKAVGGIRGLEKGLRTDCRTGLSVDEGSLLGTVSFEAVTGTDDSEIKFPPTSTNNPGSFSDRKRVFSDNSLPRKKPKSIWRLMWEQYNDKILILLSFAAVISLGLGLYQTFGVVHTPTRVVNANGTIEYVSAPPSVDWIEGVAICIAIAIVVLVGSLNDWQKERQFVKLNAKACDSYCLDIQLELIFP
jgi:Ca2+-transporting ATPase